MISPNQTYHWLPYLAASIGTLFSFFLWYIFEYDIQAYFNWLRAAETYLSWLALCCGISISILIGVIIRIAQLAKERTAILNQTNDNLKNEINERVNAEEIKQKLEVALLQGQKLQAIGTLAGGIAHDFNNILYAILGYVEMARDDVDKNSLVHKNLGKVMEAAHRGRDLVSRILAFSRRQHHEFEVIPFKKAIEAALALLRPAIPASVMIHFNTTLSPSILGNQTQLHQVLVNLINNAVDATDGEGTIQIDLSRITAKDPLLNQFPEARKQNYCKLTITDTGHGMDQHTMERIFEPFFTTKEVGKGTGLGLSIVHSIIKEHQGEITVTSQLGRGATFMILLPEHTDNLLPEQTIQP